MSHLVGHIACSEIDRNKVMDLLSYPDDDSMMLEPQKINDNIEIAFNVLKFSEIYKERGQGFLDQYDSENIDLLDFIRGL